MTLITDASNWKVRMHKVNISQEIIKRIKEFAENSVDTSINHYKKRGQSRREKIVQDIICGKLGEFGVTEFLRQHGYFVTDPDIEIYTAGKKSFDADLHVYINEDHYNIHCKSQTKDSAKKYGNSWVLQYDGFGRGHTDKLFKHRTEFDFLAATEADEVTGDVTIFCVCPIETLFDNDKIELPMVKWLEKTKRAIYYKSIKDEPYLFSFLDIKEA
jgi:hypothetical protein